MKYYIVAGETSGDLHGSNLVLELYKLDSSAVFRGIGGSHMAAAGVDLSFSLDRMDFMGFYEVIKNLFTIRRNFKEAKQHILNFKPDVVILIDYPGFNLRLAKWCKKNGFRVIYYISPKLWAWNERRVEIIKKYVDAVLCIFPFEVDFYKKHAYLNAYYVGHPLLDITTIQEKGALNQVSSDVALLPGSRAQELANLLPVMMEVTQLFKDQRFVIAGMSRHKALYPSVLPENVSIVFDQTHEVISGAKAAIVCSGTATLETALFGVPQVIIYKTSWINYEIGKRFALVDSIGLPNLIVKQKIVTELLQQDCNAARIANELTKLLNGEKDNHYDLLKQSMGDKGASEKAAKIIFDRLL